MQQIEHNDFIDSIKEDEFPMLSGVTYLDHAGTTLYCRSQLDAYQRELSATLYGNPHSHNESGELAGSAIEQSRDLVLNFFNTNQDAYSVVFTAGCTASLKLLAESFPWNAGPSVTVNKGNFTYTGDLNRDSVEAPVDHGQSLFCYLEDNHTSVIGIREVALERGADVVCFREQDITQFDCPHIHGQKSDLMLRHLLAFPAQSNFSGRKYALQWVNDIPSGKVVINDLKWPIISGDLLILLDAASLVSTSPLDLTLFPAHFVTVSFYKMFGFPTGLGALLVRNDCADLLQKRYFGGGTVSASISRSKFHIPRPVLCDRLEDGTIAFLDIVSLKHGFNALDKLGHGMEQISLHTFSLAKDTYQRLSELKHYNGRPLCILYHDNCFNDSALQGPIVNFNLLTSSGTVIGFSEVEKLAAVQRIQFRTGCFCNTGACQSALGLTQHQVVEHIKVGHVCGDSMDLIGGMPTGSIRLSFGYMSTMEDVNKLIGFVKDCFLEVKEMATSSIEGHNIVRCSPEVPALVNLPTTLEGNVISTGLQVTVVVNGSHFNDVTLENIYLYPVKSCGYFKVSKWPISNKGLLHDREWMIIKPSGNCLSQKEEPRLCLIRPHVDLDKATLTLNAEGYSPLVLSITDQTSDGDVLQSRVCGSRISGVDCGETAAQWLDHFLQGNKMCRLVRQHPTTSRMDPNNRLLSYANQAQFLAVSINSVESLCQRLNCEHTHSWNVDGVLLRFRPNLVFSGRSPFEEDEWKAIHIGKNIFTVTGKCSRCQMICVDQLSGLKDTQPLVTLRQLRNPLKTTFGIYLTQMTNVR